MFGTIRKHQAWLWVIIIAVTVVSFVIFFDPSARWSFRGRGGGTLGTIDGRPITVQDFQRAYRETELLYFLNFQKWPENDERARQMGFDLEEQTYARLIRLAKLKQEKIEVSDEAVGELARRLLGPKTPLDAFVREILLPHGITEADFERFLRHDAAIQQLGLVAGLPGKLIPPREIEANYRHDSEELALDAVFFSVSNHLAAVTVVETNLLQWYSNNAPFFREPEKVRVSCVQFHRSNFLAEVDKRFSEITNLNALLEQTYLQKGPENFKDADGKPLSKEAALARIKDDERQRGAFQLAERKANEFAGRLYDEKDHSLAGFEKFAAAQGLKTRVTEPFDEIEGPQELKVDDAFARAAFALTNKDEAISFTPVPGEDGWYVFALKERIPSRQPSFESIRNKVVERYRLTEAQRLVRQAGLAFHAKLTNGLAQGKTFSALAAESNLKTTALPPLSRRTRELPGLPEGVPLAQVKNVAFSLQVGQASSYIPSIGGGFILYLRSKLPIDEARLRAELPEYAAMMRMQRQNDAFGAWFRKASERADLPGLRASREARQQRAAGGTGTGGGPTPTPR